MRGSPWSSPHPSVGSSPHPIGSSPHPGDPKAAPHNFSPGPEHAALELRNQLYRAALLQTSSPFGPPPFPFPSTGYFPRPAFHPSLDSLPVSYKSSINYLHLILLLGEDPVPSSPVRAVLFPPTSASTSSDRPPAQLGRFETESSPLSREGRQSLASAEAARAGAGETRRPTQGAATATATATEAGEGEAVHS